MYKREMQGIALILFGMLLCFGSNEINHTIFHSISDVPLAFIGVVAGVIGLVRVFTDDHRSEKE